MTAGLLIRQAELPGQGVRDLRIAGGSIAAIAPQLAAVPGERIVQARGNALIAGLHDHHLHLFATAAARQSVPCGPPVVNDAVQLREALRNAPSDADGWIRGVGFHDSVVQRLDRAWLDVACPERPVRIQHRSGMLWVLNSRALERLHIGAGDALPAGAERDGRGVSNGRFVALDDWLGARFTREPPSLAALSVELARYGVTGVTDAGARNGADAWRALQEARRGGALRQRLLVMGNEELDEPAQDAARLAEAGPLKIYLREADLPELDALAQRIGAAHAHGRAVAFHCVTRTELVFALAALRSAGPLAGDRLEHAAIADDAVLDDIAELGLTVVTQPHFIAERGDQYLQDVERADHGLLYRAAAFLRHGIALAAGSDAPYGASDPWCAVRAAVQRRTRSGRLIGAGEQLSAARAIGLFGGDARRPGGGLRALAAGQAADLCLLDLPWEGILGDPDSRHVALTLCGGEIAYACSSTLSASPQASA